MQDFITSLPIILGDIAEFLLTDPIFYFVGILVCFGVFRLIKSICNF